MLQVLSPRLFCALAFAGAIFVAALPAHAQFFGQQAVGGVSINPDGVLSSPTTADIRGLHEQLSKIVKKPSAELAAKTELRFVSLRAVCEALQAAQGQKYEDLPAELQYLGGMQRLKFILIYPEEKDIILAGPGEGWKVDPQGNIVGETTNRPVLFLHDLMVAFETTEAARDGGVSCSIDPSAEGRRNLDAFLAQQKVMHEGVPAGVEKALGPQVISLNGVPKTSHFARTLVAADYQMKRLAMRLEDSPLPSTLPSFLEMLTKANVRIDNMMPRWWMACNYEPLGRGEDGLSWEIRGQGVKVMTEDEFVENGDVKQTGKANPIAQKWAEAMTREYDKLSEKKPIFQELRNVMDLCVAAALISKENLAEKAGLDLTALYDGQTLPQPAEFPQPRFIDSRCTLMKRGKEWIITASGGVDVNSWEVASNVADDAKVSTVRTRGLADGKGRSIWDGK